MLTWISRSLKFGVENGGGRRKLVIGDMVVANDEIDAFCARIGDFLNSLYAAIKYDYQFYTLFRSLIYDFERDAVALVIAGRDIIVNFRIKILQVTVD